MQPAGPTGASPWALSGNDTNYMPGRVSVGTSMPASTDLFTSTTSSTLSGAKAILGQATAATGLAYGVYGESASVQGVGLFGTGGRRGAELTTTGTGLTNSALLAHTGSSTTTAAYGVRAETSSPHSVPILAMANSSATSSSNGQAAIFAQNNGAHGARGLFGWATSSTGTNYGVYGQAGINGTGVYGVAELNGVHGRGIVGTGVRGEYGGFGSSGQSPSAGYGVLGTAFNNRGTGVYGTSAMRGVHGVSTSSGIGAPADHVGIYGQGTGSGYAGYFEGNVHVNGTLSKTAGSFRIDHPLDPQNQYLVHSFVESPDMKNVYDGIVVLDGGGEAWVELPAYFETLNKDCRYQLTCIGGFAPVYVADEVEDNAFRIAGGEPFMKVSWQVTGIRNDPWAQQNRLPVEVAKPSIARGTYLHPEVYGEDASLAESRLSERAVTDDRN